MDVTGLGSHVRVLVGIWCVLALLSVPAVAGGAEPGAAVQTQEPEETLEDADEFHVDVSVHEDGSATFVVDHRYQNVTEEEWAEREATIEENRDAYVADQESRWNETVTEGEDATEREMTLSNVTVETDTTSSPEFRGHVLVQFEWEMFAHQDMNQLEVADALAGVTLSSDTWLRITAPDGYLIEDVSPSPDEREDDSVQWYGEGDPFSAETPEVLMIKAQDDADDSEPTGSENGDDQALPWLIGLGALALLATVGAAWWARRNRGDEKERPGSTTEPVGTDGPGSNGEGKRPAPALLSNEERVMRLLEQRGGRIKQQEVVSELDWTEAKTSQVVNDLREDDAIEVFRIGRENVLSLPEETEGPDQ